MNARFSIVLTLAAGVAIVALAFPGSSEAPSASADKSLARGQPIETAGQEAAPVRLAAADVPALPPVATLPWDPEVVAAAPRDPRTGWPVDARVMLHMTTNNNTLYRGDEPAYLLDPAKLEDDSLVNAGKLTLTNEEREQLAGLLESHNSSIRMLEKEGWPARGLAYHHAIERGDFIRVPVSATREEVVKNMTAAEESLRMRYGEENEGFVAVVSSLNVFEEQAMIFITRAQDPEPFRIFDEVGRVRRDGKEVARRFFVGLRR
jgi:hypothetical protein